MRLDFLAARVPLTKTFTQLSDGTLEKTSYPLIKKFTSLTESVSSLTEFKTTLDAHSAAGNCLLKGQLDRTLNEESRSGHTNPLAPTNWLCLDIDGLTNISSVEVFIREVLPAPFHKVSYIVQHSASAGIAAMGLRLHVFFLLAAPIMPSVLKSWLTELNLSNTALSSQLRLSKNGLTLTYPLDRTVAQNDKLIYIAPPICIELADPMAGQRIELITRSYEKVEYSFPSPPEALHQRKTDEKITELRLAQGLKASKAKFKFNAATNEFVLTNPEKGQVTGVKEQNGFMRLNINGGDSWAYYFAPGNPKYLRNFKGEPPVVLQDFLPDFYAEWMTVPKTERSERTPIVFRCPQADVWYAGIYDPEPNRFVELNQIGSRDKIDDYFHNFNREPPDPIPDWTYQFRPDLDIVCDTKAKFANQWQPTETYRNAESYATVPPLTERILKSVVGGDKESYEHLLNWLACVVQYRVKLGTAWVLHGVQGTGKGLLVNHLLRPIIGANYCVTKELHNFDDKFNAFIETALLINVDEARVDSSAKANKIVDQLKHMITNEHLDVRGMRQNSRNVANYTNFIFTSNNYDAMRIATDDRRFNVAPRQESKLVMLEKDIDLLKLEIPLFSGYLKHVKADIDAAKRPLMNRAKVLMQEHGQNSIEQFCTAFIDGDLNFFMSLCEFGPGAANADLIVWNEAREAVQSWVNQGNTGEISFVPRIQLYAVYRYAFDPTMGRRKFCRLLEHNNVPKPKQHWFPETRKNYESLEVTWTCCANQLKDRPNLDTDKVRRGVGNVIQLSKEAAPGQPH